MRPLVMMVDVDGTIALHGDRSPFDWSRVSEDKPNIPVVRVVKDLISVGWTPIFITGRDEICRNDTEEFIMRYFSPTQLFLYMRPRNDNRADEIVKSEIYRDSILPAFEIALVFDDREKVVEMWRSTFGLTVLQVAPGKF